ncbi:hypothetical protein CHLRE_10g421576v5 [Chlamydomonas reinhardtii]|uniref:Uncharacterized protein n=1 Tax=Chlamydomonas reinhardtii TaxID=3055 RepID=A0A2K3D982_CHLRE|nr:uncharacterized protein CHLRE_10g421576v5 [Chlamydomonas reinhardtii]PNW77086.1 hypothetical protein CHLRE_10g421576v5 [Chlamydomonas reinhardtii]
MRTYMGCDRTSLPVAASACCGPVAAWGAHMGTRLSPGHLCVLWQSARRLDGMGR